MNNSEITLPRYYVFYTGLASTPVSVGIMDRTTGNDIERIPLWNEANTGKQIREAYNKHCAELTEKCNSLNSL